LKFGKKRPLKDGEKKKRRMGYTVGQPRKPRKLKEQEGSQQRAVSAKLLVPGKKKEGKRRALGLGAFERAIGRKEKNAGKRADMQKEDFFVKLIKKGAAA